MAYPSEGNGIGIERCPITHRAGRFPTILIEFWYDISSFDKQYDSKISPWAISNGDSTGYGFHADFMNGWEKGVLEKAIQEKGGCNCGCGCGQTEIEQCFGSDNVNKNSDAVFQQCSIVATNTPETAKHIEALPGNNPLKHGPALAVIESEMNHVAAPITGRVVAPRSSAGSSA